MQPAHIVLNESIDCWPDEAAFSAALLRLPLAEQARILRKHRRVDRYASALGRLLLMDGLTQLGYAHFLHDLTYTASGRPYLANGPAFNIAHSGPRVVCTIAPTLQHIGIDIEQLRQLSAADLAELHDTMTPAQWAVIDGDGDPARAYLSFWTKKESIVKAIGYGLALPMAALEGVGSIMRFGSENWRVDALDVGAGYVGHLAVRTF